MERRFFPAKAGCRLADADAGRVVPHDEMTKRFSPESMARLVRTAEADHQADPSGNECGG